DREAGDVVGGEFLQSEANAHGERAAKHGEQRQVEADGIQGKQDADDQQDRANELGEDGLRIDVERRGSQQPMLEHYRQPQRDDQRDDDRAGTLADGQYRYRRLADRQREVVERLHNLG